MRKSFAVALMLSWACLGQDPRPMPVVPPVPPLPPLPADVFSLDQLKGLNDELVRARDMAELVKGKVVGQSADARLLLEKLNLDMQARRFEYQAGADMLATQLKGHFAMMPQRGGGRDEDRYRRGTSLLDRREWDKAIEQFDEVIEAKGSRTDGALYWKAYALNKLGRRPDALNVLAELQKNHANSRWLNDAKALEVEIKQARGQGVSPEAETDEDLKIYAINSLMNTDQERALPLLDKLLRGQNSPRIKERALFVLAQSRSPKALETVSSIARGGTNPDLQLKAVEYMGVRGGPETRQALEGVYGSTADFAVKRAVLRAYMMGRDKDRLLVAAKSEQNPELRREAIHYLGVSGAQAEISQLYQSETNVELKQALIDSMFVGGNSEKLIELAKTEKDPRLRQSIIQRLGTMKRSVTGDTLASLYTTESDAGVKRQILNALFIQGNAKQLIDAARKETDPKLKREIVERLSTMKSPEATEYLVELLNK